MRLLFICVLLVFCGESAGADTIEKCKKQIQSLESTEGSAGTWGNLRNNEGSLRHETNKLLSNGLAMLDSETSITITSKPKKFLRDHRDKDYCEKKYKQTEEDPIVFSDKEFSSADELNSWISDFSQGKGSDGRELYKKCDKNCSPQYSYSIKKEPEGTLVVQADVLCGQVRDKNDNNYLLTLSCGPRE